MYCSNKIWTLWTLEPNTKHTNALCCCCSITPQLSQFDIWYALASLFPDWPGVPLGQAGEGTLSQWQRCTLKAHASAHMTREKLITNLVLSGSKMTGSSPECITMILLLSGRSQMDLVTFMVVVTLTYFTKSCSVSGLDPTLGSIKGLQQMCHWDSQHFFCLGLLRYCRKIL